jgi:uncharacterized protein
MILPMLYAIDQNDALLKAVENGEIVKVRKALSSGADVNARTSYGNPAILVAAYNGHYRVAKYLVDKGAEVNEGGQGDWTALIKTCMIPNISKMTLDKPSERLKIAELLIAKGANVNGGDDMGETSLHSCSFWGYADIVKLLITKGADVNAKNKYNGGTPLFSTVGHEGSRISEEIVLVLLKNGADVNAKEENSGFTPLHYAAKNGNTKVLKILISHGAKINAEGDKGETPLSEALKSKRIAAAKIIRAAGGKEQVEATTNAEE